MTFTQILSLDLTMTTHRNIFFFFSIIKMSTKINDNENRAPLLNVLCKLVNSTNTKLYKQLLWGTSVAGFHQFKKQREKKKITAASGHQPHIERIASWITQSQEVLFKTLNEKQRARRSCFHPASKRQQADSTHNNTKLLLAGRMCECERKVRSTPLMLLLISKTTLWKL